MFLELLSFWDLAFVGFEGKATGGTSSAEVLNG